jgi:hypothetical protein
MADVLGTAYNVADTALSSVPVAGQIWTGIKSIGTLVSDLFGLNKPVEFDSLHPYKQFIVILQVRSNKPSPSELSGLMHGLKYVWSDGDAKAYVDSFIDQFRSLDFGKALGADDIDYMMSVYSSYSFKYPDLFPPLNFAVMQETYKSTPGAAIIDPGSYTSGVESLYDFSPKFVPSFSPAVPFTPESNKKTVSTGFILLGFGCVCISLYFIFRK